MPQLSAGAKTNSLGSVALRYAAAVVSVIVAASIVECLEQFGARNPRVSILLAAIALDFWYGGDGPGLLAMVLSSVALHLIIHRHGPWYTANGSDIPYLAVFLFFGYLIHRFSRSRQRAEQQVLDTQQKLEAEVAARTEESTYRTIFDAVPFGIVQFGPDRLVRRCSVAYEKMLGMEPGEVVGNRAPLPESARAKWEQQEELLRQGKSIVDYEAVRARKDGSLFPRHHLGHASD